MREIKMATVVVEDQPTAGPINWSPDMDLIHKPLWATQVPDAVGRLIVAMVRKWEADVALRALQPVERYDLLVERIRELATSVPFSKMSDVNNDGT
jgi:hypothetical protein